MSPLDAEGARMNGRRPDPLDVFFCKYIMESFFMSFMSFQSFMRLELISPYKTPAVKN